MTQTELGADTPQTAKSASGREPVKGIFSTQSVLKVGTGTTTRKTIQKAYWYVKERAENELEIQPLNKNYVPSGPKRTITMEDLLTKFAPEPEFYISTVYPKMQELSNTIQKGERHREKGEIFSAELEFTQALRVDEDNVRATFGLGLTYLDRGESTKANDIFERLVRLDAAFDTEHKHLFNDFGISLRKNKMYAQALDYYRRAETLCESDEHLYYNVARAYLEQQEPAKALDSLRKALTLNPGLVEARKFVRYLVEKGLVSGDDPDMRALMPLDKA
ncbi:tetratricopeptide repeat protein [Fundidesulfovibrio butyratiphilus]